MAVSALEAMVRSFASGHPDAAARALESLQPRADARLTSLPIDLSVREAISALRRARRDTLYYLYVTDRVGRLIGVLDMRELLLASPRDPLETLVKREIVTVPVDMPSDEVASLIQRRRFVALPVVDRDGHLLGVVKPDEVLEAFQQEAFGDLQKMVGAGA